MNRPMKSPIFGPLSPPSCPFDRRSAIDWTGYPASSIIGSVGWHRCRLVQRARGRGGSLSDEERHAVIERTRAHIGAKPLLAGIIAHSTVVAIRQAKLPAAGASAPCFSTPPLAAAHRQTSRAPVAFVRAVSEAIDIRCPSSSIRCRRVLLFATTLARDRGDDGVVAIKEAATHARL